MKKQLPTENTVLVLQGGGALGAYQAGAYQELALAGIEPNWVAGISIGAINAAIICGNPKDQRDKKLLKFWEQVSSGLTAEPWIGGSIARHWFTEASAASVMMAGVPGFFTPRSAPMSFLPFGTQQALSVYDTAPLAKTLESLVDFDYLNEKGPRISVGAVDVETGNFAYFDSNAQRIGPKHIMASGALPPGFPPVEIDGREYWDGGLVSNTPLQHVMENAGKDPMRIFQVDLFSATGDIPSNLAEVTQREKDIQFSSRTRLTTDKYRQLHEIRAAAVRLAAKLPADLRDDPDMALLCRSGPECPITLVHLIHRKVDFEGPSKDYEFSRLSMTEHWASGRKDVERTLAHLDWTQREIGDDGLQIFDLGNDDK